MSQDNSLYILASTPILRAPIPPMGPSPSPALLPKCGLWAWTPECSHSRMVYKRMLRLFLISSPRGSSLPCKESVLSLAFLLPSSLTPSCSWVFLPHISDNSSVTNYPCWGGTIRISSSRARFQRLEHAMDRFFNTFPLRNNTSPFKLCNQLLLACLVFGGIHRNSSPFSNSVPLLVTHRR